MTKSLFPIKSNGQTSNRLAATRFTYHAKYLAAFHTKGNSMQCLMHTARSFEIDCEVID